MATGSFRFDRFTLDAGDRQLRCDGSPVDLNGRYFDALALLVSEQGRLVSKHRFHDEVWKGVPVTDEALTQCVRTLRKQLGDDASRPRFIETVPKHGYRFIAPVEEIERSQPAPSPAALDHRSRDMLALGLWGTAGGALAGLIGGIFYGFAASQAPEGGMGAISAMLVLVCVTFAVALTGAAGVAFGIAAAVRVLGPRSPWMIVGGAVGGLVVGALVKLVAVDAFSLLLGRSPGDITGAAEGLVLGGAVGGGAWLAARGPSPGSLRHGAAAAALAGGIGGILLTIAGGRLMGGSLDLLAGSFPASRLRLDQLGALFGETSFGTVSQVVTGGLEGALFSGCIVGAMIFARRNGGTER